MEWKNIDVKTDNATERYDFFVIKIHKLYEELFSVQNRKSGNLDKSWDIYVTLSGIITHGDTFFFSKLYPLQGIWVYQMVSLYLVKQYFSGKTELFKQAKCELREDWQKAAKDIEGYINAPNTGRKINIKKLMEYWIMLKKIRHNRFYKPFFKHKSFEEYEKEALAHFKSKYNLPIHELIEAIDEEARRLKL